ncbi:hypothetical protein [Treponema phagedenis]|uniref:hypothetical protein n=1 Tax=Treponema phagedenis TaxID=162 RepID=UPI0021CC7589|nr:hypothetical protein [Treponema phagedenis]
MGRNRYRLYTARIAGIVSLDEKDLPLTLPQVESYQPTGTGESPLAGITDWVNTSCPKCGAAAKRETNTMPQWAGSCWYYLRYLDPKKYKRILFQRKRSLLDAGRPLCGRSGTCGTPSFICAFLA